MLLLRAASFLCAALCSHAARAERHDGIAEAIAQTAARRNVSGDTPMALPDDLTRKDFPPLGGAKKENAKPKDAKAHEQLEHLREAEEEKRGQERQVKTEDPPLGGAKEEEAVTVSTTEPTLEAGTVSTTEPTLEAEKAFDAKVEPKLTAAETETPASVSSSPASGASVHAEHFQKTVEQTSQIKDAVERVHAKTQVAKEAAVAVKDSFGKYQGTITALKGQLDSVDDAAHKFEGELLEHLAGDESARLQPFEQYQPQFGDAAAAGETAVSDAKIGDVDEPAVETPSQSVAGENTTALAELSFLEDGQRARQAKAAAAADGTTVTDGPPMALPDDLTKKDFPPLGGAKKEAKPDAKPKEAKASSGTSGETTAASGGNRFEKSVQQSGQIKVAVEKVNQKVELAKQAAVKVKEGFEDYKGKVVEMKNQLAEVDKQQHEYHEKLLGHFDGEEGDRMAAFENSPTLDSLEDHLEEGASNATANKVALLQARERQQLSKEHVKVNAGGFFHAARH